MSGRVREWKCFESDGRPTFDAYQDLGTLAGAWTVFELQKLKRPFQRLRRFLAEEKRVEILGTQVWQSYAEFRRGQLAKDAKARSHFLRALYLDRQNIGALIELGAHESRVVDDDKRMEKGIKWLDDGKKLLDVKNDFKSELKPIFDPLWFRATYALATAEFHRFAQNETLEPHALSESEKEMVKNAAAYGIKLARCIGKTQLALRKRLRRIKIPVKVQRSLQDMLRRDDACYLAGVVAGCLASLEEPPKTKVNIEAIECTDKELWQYLTTINEETKSKDIVARIMPTAKSRSGWAADYNLACYYARAGDCGKAVKELEKTLEYVEKSAGESDVAWIRKDPTLRPVWHAMGDELHKVLEKKLA